MHPFARPRPTRPVPGRLFFALVAGTALWLSIGGAGAQVPTLPPPPDTPSSTVPAPPPPPEEEPAPVSGPATPTTGVPGAPGAPAPDGPGKPAPATPGQKPAASEPTLGSRPGTFTSSAPGLDLSEINALRRQARGRGPRAKAPDPGFDPELPFGPGTGATARSTVDSTEELGIGDSRLAKVRSLGAIAGGLDALVLFSLAVWALRQARPRSAGG